MASPGTERAVLQVPAVLWAAFDRAARGAGARPSGLVAGFIDWWTGAGPTPMRPEAQTAVVVWGEFKTVTLTLPEGLWERLERAAKPAGYSRPELVARFARWYVGDETLPPRRTTV